jgi:hypothetical protein
MVVLSAEAAMSVRWRTEKGKVQTYAIALIWWDDDEPHNVRLYDNAHGENHMHRYAREGQKRLGKKFSGGEPGEAMRTAMDLVQGGYERMIQGWLRR